MVGRYIKGHWLCCGGHLNVVERFQVVGEEVPCLELLNWLRLELRFEPVPTQSQTHR